jgi:hypothetical protein
MARGRGAKTARRIPIKDCGGRSRYMNVADDRKTFCLLAALSEPANTVVFRCYSAH